MLDIRVLVYRYVFSVEYIPSDELPLQNCIVSMSSVGDVLTMAWDTKMIIFTCMYESDVVYVHICIIFFVGNKCNRNFITS